MSHDIGKEIMNKQPEKTDATREAFITAFFRLAEIKNIYKITIKEITILPVITVLHFIAILKMSLN